MNLSYPIGTSAAEAGVARAKLQIQQTQAQLKALELQVATEVTTTALNVQSNQKRIDAATAARELAQKRLEAENSKFEVGMSTNFLVVQAQRDLADAQITELRALLDYQKSRVDFERVQRTALSRAGISVISGAGGGTTANAAVTAGARPSTVGRSMRKAVIVAVIALVGLAGIVVYNRADQPGAERRAGRAGPAAPAGRAPGRP